MNNFNYKTKKEIIIENAYSDPFLKIEDLAKMADTTSRYVRTILSESNVSLMELRKDYARKIEDNKYNLNDRLILNYMKKIPFQSKESILNVDELLINNPSDISEISDGIQHRFNYQSYKYLIKNKSWGLCTVFLDNNNFELEKESYTLLDILEILNHEINCNDVKLSNLEIIVDLSTGQISKLLDISNLCPVLRIKQNLIIDSNIVVVILLYFDTRQISFSLSHDGGITIRRKRLAE